MRTVKLFNLPIVAGTRREVYEVLVNRISSHQKTFVVTANASIIIRSIDDPEYKRIISNADLILPDGAGVVWALKRNRGIQTERVTGIDTLLYLCQMAKENQWKVFLLGGREKVISEAAGKIDDLFGNIVCGYHHGYFQDDGPVEKIRRSQADILFVGMGVPKQEKWIARNLQATGAHFAMGVGGSFDVISGYKKRAPKLFQKMRLEWLYRFLQSPIQKRHIPLEIIRFASLILRNHR